MILLFNLCYVRSVAVVARIVCLHGLRADDSLPKYIHWSPLAMHPHHATSENTSFEFQGDETYLRQP